MRRPRVFGDDVKPRPGNERRQPSRNDIENENSDETKEEQKRGGRRDRD